MASTVWSMSVGIRYGCESEARASDFPTTGACWSLVRGESRRGKWPLMGNANGCNELVWVSRASGNLEQQPRSRCAEPPGDEAGRYVALTRPLLCGHCHRRRGCPETGKRAQLPFYHRHDLEHQLFHGLQRAGLRGAADLKVEHHVRPAAQRGSPRTGAVRSSRSRRPGGSVPSLRAKSRWESGSRASSPRR